MDQLPITDEQAKAVQELAKFGGVTVEAVRDLGRFIAGLIDAPLQDAIGLLWADKFRVRRIRNLLLLKAETEELLRARGVEHASTMALSVAIPLLEAASDESRDELVKLWARLLAAAADPTRAGRVRLSFVELLKKFDPVDALVFQRLDNPGVLQPSGRSFLGRALEISEDDVEVSFVRLVELGIGRDPSSPPGRLPAALHDIALTAVGRELRRVLG